MILRLNEQGKVVLSGEQVFIGGNNTYASTCRKHYKLRQPGVIQIKDATCDNILP